MAPRGPKPKGFWFYVDKGEPNECWEFFGARHYKGYGEFRVGSSKQKAHRIAWTELIGPIPESMHVLHKCDNPPCCNPAHLFLGTDADNRKDMLKKERYGKLSFKQAKEIRNLYETGLTHQEIADLFNVSRTTISDIIRAERWTK
jgi:hypothetical protein